ncbi:MAG: hypothetical protein KAS30_03575, partial [Candidatus Diapherotrites archaeon]|nr:hypothetical protein [Candidatus Diapherotrites archaeon]
MDLKNNLINQSKLTPHTIITVDTNSSKNNLSVEEINENSYWIKINAINEETALRLFEYVIYSGSNTPMGNSILKVLLNEEPIDSNQLDDYSKSQKMYVIGNLIFVGGYSVEVSDIQLTFENNQSEIRLSLIENEEIIASEIVLEGESIDFNGIINSNIIVNNLFVAINEKNSYAIISVERKTENLTTKLPLHHDYKIADVIDVDGYLVEVSDIDSFLFEKHGVVLTLFDGIQVLDRQFLGEKEKTDFNGILDSFVYVHSFWTPSDEKNSSAKLIVQDKHIVGKYDSGYIKQNNSDKYGIKDSIIGVEGYTIEISDIQYEPLYKEYLYLTLYKGNEVINKQKMLYKNSSFQKVTDFDGILNSN